MSNGIESIDLYRIEAPELSDASYGESIKDRFDKINDNFNKIANSGFLRGVQGESIKVEKILLNDSDEEGRKWLNAIKSKMNELYSTELLSPIIRNNIQINWYDKIINKYIYVYSTVIENEDDSSEFVSMLPFTVKDARYYFNDYLSDEYKALYENIEDVSCVVGFNGEKDKSNNPIIELINTMPTIYFDAVSKSFCWKVWGTLTGLIANGPQGKDGENGDLIICIRGDKSDGNNYNITHILSNGEQYEVSDKNYFQYNGKPAIILPNTTETNIAGFWVSNLNIKDNETKLYAICANYNNILTELTIDANYFASDIAPNITSYFLKFSDHVFNIKKIKESDKDIVVMDNTESENSLDPIVGDLKIKLNTSIEPVSDKGTNNAIEVTEDGIFITLNGKRYQLSSEDGTSLKLESAPKS